VGMPDEDGGDLSRVGEIPVMEIEIRQGGPSPQDGLERDAGEVGIDQQRLADVGEPVTRSAQPLDLQTRRQRYASFGQVVLSGAVGLLADVAPCEEATETCEMVCRAVGAHACVAVWLETTILRRAPLAAYFPPPLMAAWRVSAWSPRQHSWRRCSTHDPPATTVSNHAGAGGKGELRQQGDRPARSRADGVGCELSADHPLPPRRVVGQNVVVRHDDEITSDELDELLDEAPTLRAKRPTGGTEVRLYVAVDAETLHDLEERAVAEGTDLSVVACAALRNGARAA